MKGLRHIGLMIYIFATLILTPSLAAYADDISKQKAVDIASKNKPGRVLKVNKIKSKDHNAYRVKVLSPQGDVSNIIIDAKTGKLMQNKRPKKNK